MSSLLAHSRIGASSMHRWAKCPGSVARSEGIPPTSSPYAEEGTDAHTLAAFRLINRTWPYGGVDAEMYGAVELYVQAVESEITPHDVLLVEHRFDLGEIHPGLFGTCDAVGLSAHQRKLKVFDYKHGQGVAVEVKDNLQLQYYALGALLTSDFACDEVEMVIVQPRCPHPDGPIRRWTVPAIQLLDFAAELKAAAQATEIPGAPLVAGEHCRFCPAAGSCPELQSKARALAKLEFSPAQIPDPEKLSQALDWLPVLENWIKNVRDFAYGEASRGRIPPGYKLVNKRATRKWKDEQQAAEYLAREFPKVGDLFEPLKLKSPAQIEKVLHKKQMPKLADLIVSQSSGTTLVREGDAREAVAALDARSEFELLDVLS